MLFFLFNGVGASRAWLGFLASLFLGPFGFLFMFCWSAGSFARRSFFRGWLITFIIMLVFAGFGAIYFFWLYPMVIII